MIAVLFLIYVCNHSYEVVYGLEKAIVVWTSFMETIIYYRFIYLVV